MTLEIQFEECDLWRGRWDGGDALWRVLPRLPGAWSLWVRPSHLASPRFPARATLLLATSLAELGWGCLLEPDGTTDVMGDFREQIRQHVIRQEWRRLPDTYGFRFHGPTPEAAHLTLWTATLLLSQGETRHPYRLPAVRELRDQLDGKPHAEALEPWLALLDHYGTAGTLGFRRRGRRPTTSRIERREQTRQRLARFRERHKKDTSSSPNG